MKEEKTPKKQLGLEAFIPFGKKEDKFKEKRQDKGKRL